MKRYTVFSLLVLASLLSAAALGCTPSTVAPEDATLIIVSDGRDNELSYSDIKTMSSTNVEVGGVTYVGVTIAGLLADVGVDAGEVAGITAIASDGFSATYEPELFLGEQTIVAYATADGALPADEQPFRMVLPDQPGRMNVRMLARIEVSR